MVVTTVSITDATTPVTTAVTTQELLGNVDEISAKYLTEEWTGSITFKVDVGGTGWLQEVDICQCIGINNRLGFNKLYVDFFKYPPPLPGLTGRSLPKTDPTWLRLLADLQTASFESGSPIVCNGSRSGGRERRFVCKYCSRVYRTPSYGKKTDPFCQDSFINSDKKGQRVDGGRKKSRKTVISQSLTKGDCCPFHIEIKWDARGFYIAAGSGSPYHKFHPRLDSQDISLPSKLIPEQEKETLIALADACVGAGVGQNYIHSKLGKYLSRSKIVYLQKSSPTSPLHPHLQKSDIDKLLDFFQQSKDISYQVLWDLPMDTGTTGLVSSCRSADTGRTANIHHVNDDDMADAKEMVANARQIDGIHPQSRIFMCVAWANLDEIRLFKLFPEVMHCDATCGTSNSKNHLLAFSGRTSTAKQFIFLQIWLANQRRSTFNWVFHVVLPTFIHRTHLQRVQLIMVDGNPQQGSKVATALKSYMPTAFFGKCGYHIIHQGWKRHGPTCSSLPTSLWVEYGNFCTTVKSWLFSFMSEGCVEDEAEYELSKELLFASL
jgi:hypothetical protein